MTQLKLLSSCPAKRFDIEPRLSADGRGGWMLSQINTDRWISDYEDYYLIFYFAALATRADKEDYVEKTRLSATMNGEPIGENEYRWRIPNPMWSIVDGDSIFEWGQAIDLTPTRDGLITLSLDVKLHLQEDWLPVEGNAYARIKNVGEMPQFNWKWASPFTYSLMRLIPKRFRRSRSEW